MERVTLSKKSVKQLNETQKMNELAAKPLDCFGGPFSVSSQLRALSGVTQKIVTFQLNGQGPWVDRFVAPRAAFPELRWRMARARTDPGALDFWCDRNLQKKKYVSYLDNAFGLKPAIAEPTMSWPCVPRRKGYLSTTDSVLDLPAYRDAAFPELLDWGSDNILVAALGRNYHKWSWRTQSLASQGLASHRIHCCKFDPQGDILALGTDCRGVEVHDNLLNKCVARNMCRCVVVGRDCFITALSWSPTGNSFITGCSRGMMSSFERNLNPLHWLRPTREPIHLLRVSPNARYVAAAALYDGSVLILSWPNLRIITVVGWSWTVKTFNWHPWRSALLGIGVGVNRKSKIALWDANSGHFQNTTLSSNDLSLDVMLFSHRTGEMVLSLWNSDPENAYLNMGSHLMVLSGPQTMVDHFGDGHKILDRIRTMIFSPDGTKLAAATVGEDLIIWNFLKEEQGKNKIRYKKFSDLPVYLDKVMYGFSLR